MRRAAPAAAMLLSACAGASGRAATADRTIERLLDRTCLPFVSGRASEAEAVRAGEAA